jgi:tripartite-type tricarboxylate transporter receptor subunit TctC
VTSARPSQLVPGLPAVAESVPGYEAQSMFGIFAPRKTPAPIVALLNQAIVQELNRPEIREKLLASGNVVVAGTPQQSAAMLKAEIAKWSKVIKEAGIKED